MKHGFFLINTLTNSLVLPQLVINELKILYQRLVDKRLTQGRSIESLIGACCYIACCNHDYPINQKELCAILELTIKQLVNTRKFVKRVLDLKVGLIKPASYVISYSHKLSLSHQDVSVALSRVAVVSRLLVNKMPESIASVCVYSTGKVSIRSVAEVSGLSKNHLSACIKVYLAGRPVS